MKLGRFQALALPAHLLAHLVRHGRHVGQPFRQRLEIEARSADEDRQLPALDVLQDLDRVGDVAADGEIHGGIHVAVEPVRSLGLFLRRGAGGDDAKVAIDLHGIGVDHHAVEALSQFDAQCGLA